MSFFDEYTEISGTWLTAPEKAVLMENGIPIQITAIELDEQNKFGPRYVCTALVPDPETGSEEEKLIGFPRDSGVDSRTRMLVQMAEYLERDGAEPVTVKLEKVGNAIIIRQA